MTLGSSELMRIMLLLRVDERFIEPLKYNLKMNFYFLVF